MAIKMKGVKNTKTKVVKAKSGSKRSTTTKNPKKTKTSSTKTKSKSATLKISKPYTKSALLSTLAERAALKRQDVANFLEQLNIIIEGHLKKNGPGKFVIPGIVKMSVKNVPAKKARKGISPFTGEAMTFKAKPASHKVKVMALKTLKEMAR